jgi:hypothetical protein
MMQRRAGLVVLALVATAGCSGSVTGTGASGLSSGGSSASSTTTTSATTTTSGTSTTTTSGTSTTTTSSGSGGQGGCPPQTPGNHRAVATPCSPSTPATACTTDADCMMGDGFGSLIAGKCVASSAGQTCDYNQCASDSTCPDPTNVCICEGQAGNHDSMFGSECLPANCHTDADCGPNGFCSPSGSVSCGDAQGYDGWYCHTCADTCVNTEDCPMQTGMPPSSCVYDPTVGHWTCTSGFCAG